MQKRILVWFRNDLRIHDNETLLSASKNALEIIPVYVIDQRLLDGEQYMSKRIGAHRVQFLLQSLEDLRLQLQNKGGDLLVVTGHPVDEIVRLASEFKVHSVYYNQEVGYYEWQDEMELQKKLNPLGVEWESFWTSTLVSKEDLPFSIRQLPNVFTSFRQKIERECSFGNIQPEPLQLISPKFNITLPRIDQLGFVQKITHHDSAFPFKGGETTALQHLHNYLWETHHVANYKNTRNEMIGTSYSTKFSPWLSNGSLSASYVLYELMRYENQIEKNESTYWVLFELLWRDFFKFSAYLHGKNIFHLNGIKQNLSNHYSNSLERFAAWKTGKTGNDFIDANMRELHQTGWMSNRGRQNVASYLVHDLNIDWRWGAAYFEEALLDYDVASNWGNWAYIAGVGHDPRPFRKFNIEKQANDYDKHKNYRKLWLKN